MTERRLPLYNPYDWYWVVGDTNPTTQVFSSATKGMVANTAVAFLAWLDNNQWGTAAIISGAANNGSGLIRLTVDSTAQMQTGQTWRVIDDAGIQSAHYTITVISSTTVDLQSSTFSASFTGLIGGATVVDTFAHLATVLNNAAIDTFPPNHQVLTFTAGVATLTSPLSTVNIFETTTAGAKIILPSMTDPASPAIGDEIVFKNTASSASSVSVDIYASDGTTLLATAYQGDVLSLALKSNSTANGQWTAAVSQLGNNIGQVWEFTATQRSSGLTTLPMQQDQAVVRTRNGVSRYLPFFVSGTLDISTAGPALNGRDQAAAFAAGDTISAYLIWGPGQTAGYIASKQLLINGPALPAGYTHYAWTTQFVLDASANIPITVVGRAGTKRHQGSTQIASATTTDLEGPFEHFEITGNTNITGFVIEPGKRCTLRFVSAGGQLQPGASLIVPGGANITWAAGDSCLVQYTANPSQATVLAYFRADGSPLTVAASEITNTMLANAAAYTFKGNVTGSSAAPTDFTIAGLTHKATPAGTDLLVISDEAASHATKYCTITEALGGSASISLGPPGGRLTLVSGTPVMTSDQTAKTVLYYTPAIHDQVWLYNGSSWVQSTFSEISLTLDATNATATKHYDIFLVDDTGTKRIGYGPDWSAGAVAGSNTIGSASRGTGAGSTELQRLNGRWTNKNSITVRYDSTHTVASVGANQALYLGTILVTTAGQLDWKMRPAAANGGSGCQLTVYNAYNRVDVPAFSRDNISSYTFTSATFQKLHNNDNNALLFVDGLQESASQATAAVAAFLVASALNDTAQYALGAKANWSSGVGDSMGPSFLLGNGGTIQTTAPMAYTESFSPLLGGNRLHLVEYCKTSGTGTVTVYGSGWNADLTQTLQTSFIVFGM